MANYDLDYEGSVVQDILDTGKSLEDDGYIFLGTATPSTIPGTPIERVAYVGGPGTYNNFGTTVVVPSGSIVVITYSGSAWSKTVINASLPVSTTLGSDNTTIPTSKAVKDVTDAINTKLGEGYVYVGIATATTNPGTPTGKVFYLAKDAGTYTNFGGLTLTEGVNVLKYNGTAWSQEQLISIADIYKNPLMGYYECDTAGATAAKTVAATGYVLPTTGGSVKIKMANRNTVSNATLNINSTGAKPLFYNGVRAGVGNTWDTNEIVEVFYDGTNYQAYNVAGSNGDGVFDISAYNLTDGQPTPYVDLAAALGTDGANVPQSLRKGGMSVKFIQGSVQSSDNKYVQYICMAQNFTTDVTQWQGIDLDYPRVYEKPTDIVSSGALFNELKDLKKLWKGQEVKGWLESAIVGIRVADGFSIIVIPLNGDEKIDLKGSPLGETWLNFAKIFNYPNYEKVDWIDVNRVPITTNTNYSVNLGDGEHDGAKYLLLTHEANVDRKFQYVFINGKNIYGDDFYIDRIDFDMAGKAFPSSKLFEGTFTLITGSSYPFLNIPSPFKWAIVPIEGVTEISIIGSTTTTSRYTLLADFNYPYYQYANDITDVNTLPIDGSVNTVQVGNAKYLAYNVEFLGTDRTPKSIKLDGHEILGYDIRDDIDSKLPTDIFDMIVGEGVVQTYEVQRASENVNYGNLTIVLKKGTTIYYSLAFYRREDKSWISNPIYDHDQDNQHRNNPYYIDPVESPTEFANRPILGKILITAQSVNSTGFYPSKEQLLHDFPAPEWPVEDADLYQSHFNGTVYFSERVPASAQYPTMKARIEGTYTTDHDCILKVQGLVATEAYPDDQSYVRIDRTITELVKPEVESMGLVKDFSLGLPTTVLSNRKLDLANTPSPLTFIIENNHCKTTYQGVTVFVADINEDYSALVYRDYTGIVTPPVQNEVTGYLAKEVEDSETHEIELRYVARLINGKLADEPDDINSVITYASVLTLRSGLYYMYYQGQFSSGITSNNGYGQNFAWSNDGFNWNRSLPDGVEPIEPKYVDENDPAYIAPEHEGDPTNRFYGTNVLFKVGRKYVYNVYITAKNDDAGTTDYCIEVMQEMMRPREFVEACACKVDDVVNPFRFIGNKTVNYIKVRIKNTLIIEGRTVNVDEDFVKSQVDILIDSISGFCSSVELSKKVTEILNYIKNNTDLTTNPPERVSYDNLVEEFGSGVVDTLLPLLINCKSVYTYRDNDVIYYAVNYTLSASLINDILNFYTMKEVTTQLSGDYYVVTRDGGNPATKHWKKLYMFKSADGIHWGDYDTDGIEISELAYDTQVSAIPCGSTIKLYHRCLDYAQLAQCKRCIGVMFIDLEGNIISSSTELFGTGTTETGGAYNSGAFKIDNQRELLLPSMWNSVIDFTTFEAYIVDGGKVYNSSYINEFIKGSDPFDSIDPQYVWGTVNPGFILKDGDQYITINLMSKGHNNSGSSAYHTPPAGIPIKTEIRLYQLHWAVNGSSNTSLNRPTELVGSD